MAATARHWPGRLIDLFPSPVRVERPWWTPLSHAVTTPSLTKVERAILAILRNYPGDEVLGRDLRTRLRRQGFRRSAPALVFTMMSLEDKGLVTCRQEVRGIEGVEVTERYYRTMRGGEDG